MNFSDWLHFNAYRCFLNFGDIDETTESILEMFNTELTVTKINSIFDFTTEWEIDGTKYHFGGKQYGIEWTMGFDKKSDFSYVKTNSNKYLGDIFSGVFISLSMLMKEHAVKILAFSTPSTHTWLIKFYNSKTFKQYLEKHFKFNLFDEGSLHGMTFWRYERF